MGMMGYGFGGYGALGGIGMILGMVMQLALAAAVVMGVIWLFRTAARPERGASGPEALSILQQRYAKGEIGDDEYLKIKKELA